MAASDSSEPNWELIVSDSDPDWTPSTICAALYPIFLMPEDMDSGSDTDDAVEESEWIVWTRPGADIMKLRGISSREDAQEHGKERDRSRKTVSSYSYDIPGTITKHVQCSRSYQRKESHVQYRARCCKEVASLKVSLQSNREGEQQKTDSPLIQLFHLKGIFSINQHRFYTILCRCLTIYIIRPTL